MKKPTIITFANHKGGVGKTTTTASVGTTLASIKYKVLLIDLDAQANLTGSLVHDIHFKTTIYDSLVHSDTTSLQYYKIKDNLWIIPASLQLASADLELASVMAREKILSELIHGLKDYFDFILIDCPPSLGLLTLNGITASDLVVIPLQAEVLPFTGLTMITNFIKMVQKKLNPSVNILGILITRWEKSNLSKQIEDGLRLQLKDLVFKTKIRKNIKVAEAPLEAENIIDYDPSSHGSLDYKAFTHELLNKIKSM